MKYVVRKGSLTGPELFLQKSGKWGPSYSRAYRGSSQDAAERFVRRHVSGEDWGLFSTASGRRTKTTRMARNR